MHEALGTRVYQRDMHENSRVVTRNCAAASAVNNIPINIAKLFHVNAT